MVRAEVLRKRLGKLDEYLAILQALRYVSIVVDGIYRLMHSDLQGPANTRACGGAGVGNPEPVTVKELVDMVTQVSGKRINVEWVKVPARVQSRNFSNERIDSTGWRAGVSTL